MGDKPKTSQIKQNLFTLKEAAVYLGRTTWSVRELVWNGFLPVIRTHSRGKQWIALEDLEAFKVRYKRFESPARKDG